MMKSFHRHLIGSTFVIAGSLAAGAVSAHADEAVDASLTMAIAKLNTQQQAALTVLVSGLSEGDAGGDLSAAIPKLNPERKAALLVLVNGIVEASTPQESPEEGAMKTVSAYVKAAEDGDVDTLMAQVSENFNHYEAGDKAGLKAFVDRVKTEGMLEDIIGNTKDAKTTVEGDLVTVYPVELEGIFGTVTYEFHLKKEGDTWKIVGFEVSGV